MALLARLWILTILGFLAFMGDDPPSGLLILFFPIMWPYLLAITIGPLLMLWLIASTLKALFAYSR